MLFPKTETLRRGKSKRDKKVQARDVTSETGKIKIKDCPNVTDVREREDEAVKPAFEAVT